MNNEPNIESDIALAHQIADAAALVSLSYFRNELKSWSKSDGSIATEADIAVEDGVRARLGVERPGDAMLGEERGASGQGRRRWIIDAIDGTIQFEKGDPDWGTLIALEVDGRVVVGVCDQPVRQRRYWAVRGQGAFLSGEQGVHSRLTVSAARELTLARSFLPSGQWVPDDIARRMANALATATSPEPHIDHPALQVATGGYELAVFFTGGPWDIAAPSLIVEEAGGRFTNISGDIDLTTGTAIFSNGILHDDILNVIRRS